MMDKFWSSWQDLANNPSDLSAREAVKSAAVTMIDVFQAVYQQIEEYGLSMNNPLQQKVKQVNDITGQIYALNERIAGVEANPKEKANDTRDQRDQLVRELSELDRRADHRGRPGPRHHHLRRQPAGGPLRGA